LKSKTNFSLEPIYRYGISQEPNTINYIIVLSIVNLKVIRYNVKNAVNYIHAIQMQFLNGTFNVKETSLKKVL
jgi:hypothetical protein